VGGLPDGPGGGGAAFIAERIIQVTDKLFDDFADTGADRATTCRMLGLG